MATAGTFDLIDMSSPLPNGIQAHPLYMVDSFTHSDSGDDAASLKTTTAAAQAAAAATKYAFAFADVMDCDVETAKDQPQPMEFTLSSMEASVSPILWRTPQHGQAKPSPTPFPAFGQGTHETGMLPPDAALAPACPTLCSQLQFDHHAFCVASVPPRIMSKI